MCARNAALQRVLRSPRHDQRVQAVRPIEFVILQRVDDVEADEPEHNRRGEREHLKDFQRRNVCAFDRQPRANRRQRQRDSEKDMRVIREALGQRIKTNHDQRDGREIETKWVKKKTGRDKPGGRKNAECYRAHKADLARGQMAVRRARIERVEFAVHDAIESSSRRCARKPSRRESVQMFASPASRDCRARPQPSPPARTAGRRACGRTGRSCPTFE